MDVLRLNTSTFIPDTLVEGYNSMIWTERYLGNGEFELKTTKVSETKALIPEGQLITLRDTKEVMIVESHSITRSDENNSELTVKGRSFETCTEHRAIVSLLYNKPWTTIKKYKTSEVSAMLLWNAIVNPTIEDITTQTISRFAEDAIPQVVITDSSNFVDTVKDWTLKSGYVYPQVLDFLILGKFGIRNIRPSNTSGNVITFDATQTTTRGNLQKVLTSNIPQLRVDVYDGYDRTRQQTVLIPIIFYYNAGHIISPQYLFSDKDYKNTGLLSYPNVNGSYGRIWVLPNPPASGLNRKTLYEDAGDRGDQVDPAYTDGLFQKIRVELGKHKKTVMFDGAISPISPYKYNVDYFLGDKVTLMAEYGVDLAMFVSEYIRTEDSTGDRGYPTLILAS